MQYTPASKKRNIYHVVIDGRAACNVWTFGESELLSEPPTPKYTWQRFRICRSCESELKRRAAPPNPQKPLPQTVPTDYEIELAKWRKWHGQA